jgi:hypothetical protein
VSCVPRLGAVCTSDPELLGSGMDLSGSDRIRIHNTVTNDGKIWLTRCTVSAGNISINWVSYVYL